MLLKDNQTFYFLFGGPPRTRIWNLPVRSRAPYPIWPAVPDLFVIKYIKVIVFFDFINKF